MNEKLNRDRVKGFLRTKDRTIVNEKEEEIILTGWGVGNWLLCEGYMWMSNGSERFDRPNRIEAVIQELTGSVYAKEFWRKFRENYITKADIRRMAELGYNSVRIPFNWRLFMESEPGIVWKEEGFELLDRCLDWCEEYKIYAFLDMHGAPGGQTGANIDDCIDNVPRLFLDQDCWDKGIALWKKLAERYYDRWIVGGYDLLNEPIAPGAYDYLLPKLEQFYEEAIKAIRSVDRKHLFSIEGHHWATNTSVFHKKYDDNMVIHFHRYACLPEISAFTEYMELSERLNAPLWLGETGENIHEWFTAMYPLSVDLGIGYNLWPWKKMNRDNSPYAIRIPEGWDELIGYSKGAVHPGYERAQKILDQFLENMKMENCDFHAIVNQSVFRTPGCRVRATDFDELPGLGISYSGLRTPGNPYHYREATGMGIIEKSSMEQRRFAFDCQWDRFVLELLADEFAVYSINNLQDLNYLSFEYYCEEDTEVTVYQDDVLIGTLQLTPVAGKYSIEAMKLMPAQEAKIKIVINQGRIELDNIQFH
jgi:hypothetical protein